MADQTITATAEPGERVRYDLGPGNWGAPVPDLRQPGSTVALPVERLIDVVILGDGYTSEPEFRAQLASWMQAFYRLAVYESFAGAFRIRGLYTPSVEPTSADRRSYYRCQLTDDDSGVLKDDSWLTADNEDSSTFRRRLWDSVDSFDDINPRRYAANIHVGDNLAIRNEHLRDTYRNLVVAMLVRTADFDNVSGMTANVRRDPTEPLNARVAFGANVIHEFSHAFGFLSDEYIDGRDRANTRDNASEPSVLTASNLSFSDRDDSVPWLHLAPTGRFPRTAGGSEPSPVAGWLWVGGAVHTGAWHSEYRCLMNGTHDNFAFTQVESEDPTATDGYYTDENGADLRDVDRFCAWCQEITTIRILEKTDQFLEPGDPADPTEQGKTWFARWVNELRDSYYTVLAVGQQITDTETHYAAMTPGRHGEPLWQSDLYRVPRASTSQGPSSMRMLDDGETYLVLGYTAIP